MRTPDAKLGIHLLETITQGMYSQPLHIVREYIQNAFDSIREARRINMIESTEGCIEIIVDPQSKTLCIRDDGTGLDPEEAAVYLVDIGNSKKAESNDKARENAGFRGIGRMAGISYCDRLVFETSNGNGLSCVVSFDALNIRKLARPGQPPTAIATAINNNCHLEERASAVGTSFFKVSLERVTNNDLLDVDTLAAYLELTAPVRFDPTIWSYGNIINSMASEAGFSQSLDTVSVRVCGPDGAVHREVYRPFKDSFTTRDGRGKKNRRVDVSGVTALPRDSKYRGWWGWLAQHQRQGALADTSYHGLRIRMHNIAIGDQGIVQQLWTTRNLAVWCFGEIHVDDDDFVPNSQRDDFEPTEAYTRLLEQLREEVRWVEKDIRNESKHRNRSVPVITRNVTKTIRTAQSRLDSGLTSHNEKAQLIDELDNKANTLKNALQDRTRNEDERSELRKSLDCVEEVKNKIAHVNTTVADKSMSHLTKQTRKTVREILRVVREELSDQKQFAVIEEKVFLALRPGGRDH